MMPRPVENVPEWMEEHPQLADGLSQAAYDWPDELIASLEAEVAAHRLGGDAA